MRASESSSGHKLPRQQERKQSEQTPGGLGLEWMWCRDVEKASAYCFKLPRAFFFTWSRPLFVHLERLCVQGSNAMASNVTTCERVWKASIAYQDLTHKSNLLCAGENASGEVDSLMVPVQLPKPYECLLVWATVWAYPVYLNTHSALCLKALHSKISILIHVTHTASLQYSLKGISLFYWSLTIFKLIKSTSPHVGLCSNFCLRSVWTECNLKTFNI